VNQVEKDMAYMIASGQWWLNEKWFFGVFPLVALVIATAISVHKKMDLEQFFVVSVFSWIGVCLVALFLYHTSWNEMKIHFANWMNAFAPVADNSGFVFKRSGLHDAFWVFIFIVFFGGWYFIYEDSKPKKPKA